MATRSEFKLQLVLMIVLLAAAPARAEYAVDRDFILGEKELVPQTLDVGAASVEMRDDQRARSRGKRGGERGGSHLQRRGVDFDVGGRSCRGANGGGRRLRANRYRASGRCSRWGGRTQLKDLHMAGTASTSYRTQIADRRRKQLVER